jgi:hypothetical protein
MFPRETKRFSNLGLNVLIRDSITKTWSFMLVTEAIDKNKVTIDKILN